MFNNRNWQTKVLQKITPPCFRLEGTDIWLVWNASYHTAFVYRNPIKVETFFRLIIHCWCLNVCMQWAVGNTEAWQSLSKPHTQSHVSRFNSKWMAWRLNEYKINIDSVIKYFVSFACFPFVQNVQLQFRSCFIHTFNYCINLNADWCRFIIFIS